MNAHREYDAPTPERRCANTDAPRGLPGRALMDKSPDHSTDNESEGAAQYRTQTVPELAWGTFGPIVTRSPAPYVSDAGARHGTDTHSQEDVVALRPDCESIDARRLSVHRARAEVCWLLGGFVAAQSP
ncbi:MAG TPA: hypothetical protein VIP79_07335 [Gemmatimonadaceae bacterium]